MNVAIIGATSGIGRRLWEHYSSGHNMVAVMGRRVELLEEMAASRRENTLTYACDISDMGEFDRALEAMTGELGSLDIAILCAGIGELNPALDASAEIETARVNVDGWTNAAVGLYRLFERQGWGQLVTVTSVGGLMPAAMAPAYSASKAYQINYTKALQRKSNGTGVVVTEIRPGLVDTRMAKGDGLFWVMPVDKVASQIVKAIARRRRLAVVSRRWRLANYILRHI
ncbi:MAG: SDR family NAD(P)-dependent oxidoreductase [Muribaculum intestinale]|nr:SDR family NAD(P)-dependent oxidoreductase [Muribaculum intestinale]